MDTGIMKSVVPIIAHSLYNASMKDKPQNEGKLQQTTRNEHGITRGAGYYGR